MRAVVADDDRGTATIVTNLLERSNLEVAVAHDGNTAWNLLTAAPPPALAIIDWMMPGVDGLELCRRIKREASLAGTLSRPSELPSGMTIRCHTTSARFWP